MRNTAAAGLPLAALVHDLGRPDKVLVGLLEELESAGVAFRAATEPIDTSTPTGRMLVQLRGVFAEFERATIIDRVVAGMERKAARGGWPGRAIPYGLCLDDDKHLAIDPSEFPLVERIFTRYGIDQAGAATIAAELNADACRTRSGRRWSPQAVLFILRNRSYLGDVTFRDVCHQPDESLIDPVLFEKAQVRLAERGESYDRRMTAAHPDYPSPGSSPALDADATTSASPPPDAATATATTPASPARRLHKRFLQDARARLEGSPPVTS